MQPQPKLEPEPEKIHTEQQKKLDQQIIERETDNDQWQTQSQQQEDEQEVDTHQYKQNVIINPDGTNQLLTLIVQPGKTAWYQGEIVASNRPYTDLQPKLENFDFQRFWHYLKMKGKVTTKITNNGIDMAYFCVRRRGGGGKILIMDERVYQQSLLIDFSKLLTINIAPTSYKLQAVPDIPYLSAIFLAYPKEIPPLYIALQSNQGNLIFQKSLGPEQKLFIGSSQIIVMSQKLQIKKDENNQISLIGPGFVFLEVPTNIIPNSAMKAQAGVGLGGLIVFLIVFIVVCLTF